MTRFEQNQLGAAVEFSRAGGQALHVHRFNLGGHKLFRRYPEIAHLFDQDLQRLVDTARSLGVRVVAVEHQGTDRQHVDLCGKPFDRAAAKCDAPELF